MSGRGQATLVHVVTCFSVVDHVDEFGLHQLAIVVNDWIFEGVFVALSAFTFVAACFESSAQNRDALKCKYFQTCCGNCSFLELT